MTEVCLSKRKGHSAQRLAQVRAASSLDTASIAEGHRLQRKLQGRNYPLLVCRAAQSPALDSQIASRRMNRFASIQIVNCNIMKMTIPNCVQSVRWLQCQ